MSYIDDPTHLTYADLGLSRYAQFDPLSYTYGPFATALGVSPELGYWSNFAGHVTGYGIPSFSQTAFNAGPGVPAGPGQLSPFDDINGMFSGSGAFAAPAGITATYGPGHPAAGLAGFPSPTPGPEAWGQPVVDTLDAWGQPIAPEVQAPAPAPEAPTPAWSDPVMVGAPLSENLLGGIDSLKAAYQQQQQQQQQAVPAPPEAPTSPYNSMQYGAAVPLGAPPVTMLDTVPQAPPAPPTSPLQSPEFATAVPPGVTVDMVKTVPTPFGAPPSPPQSFGPPMQGLPESIQARVAAALAAPDDAPPTAPQTELSIPYFDDQRIYAPPELIDTTARPVAPPAPPQMRAMPEVLARPPEYGVPPAPPTSFADIDLYGAPVAAPPAELSQILNDDLQPLDAYAQPAPFSPSIPAPPSPPDISSLLGMGQVAGLGALGVEAPEVDERIDTAFPSFGDEEFDFGGFQEAQSYSLPGGGVVDIGLSTDPRAKAAIPDETETFDEAMDRALGAPSYPGQTYDQRMHNVALDIQNRLANEQWGVAQAFPGSVRPQQPVNFAPDVLAALTPEQQFAQLAATPPAPPAPTPEVAQPIAPPAPEQFGMAVPEAPAPPTAPTYSSMPSFAEAQRVAAPASPQAAFDEAVAGALQAAQEQAPPVAAPRTQDVVAVPSVQPQDQALFSVAPPAPPTPEVAVARPATNFNAVTTQPSVAAPPAGVTSISGLMLGVPEPPAPQFAAPITAMPEVVTPTPEQIEAFTGLPAPPTPVAAFDEPAPQFAAAPAPLTDAFPAPPTPPSVGFASPVPTAPPTPSIAAPAPPAPPSPPSIEAPVGPPTALPSPPSPPSPPSIAAPPSPPTTGPAPSPEVASPTVGDPMEGVQVGFEVGKPTFVGGPIATNLAGDTAPKLGGIGADFHGGLGGINMGVFSSPQIAELGTSLRDAAGPFMGGPPSPPSMPDTGLISGDAGSGVDLGGIMGDALGSLTGSFDTGFSEADFAGSGPTAGSFGGGWGGPEDSDDHDVGGGGWW